MREEDESGFSKVLPIDDATTERKQPWLLHSLDVNALNFCSFAMCPIPHDTTPEQQTPEQKPDEILLAYPGVQDGLINLTSLPTATRVATLPPPPGLSTGMLMAVSVRYSPSTTSTPPSPLIAAGYESGHVALWRQQRPTTSSPGWKATYITKPHAQPVLSIAISPDSGSFYSSSADAVVARHPIPSDSPRNTGSSSAEDRPLQVLQTKHAGQQALAIRSDGRIFATAGWDGRVRVYSSGGSGSGGGSGSSSEKGKMKELAVLKWHKEGCYAAAFGEVLDQADGDGDDCEGASAGTVSQRREAKTQATHWLAAGSKDGKVSLWDVY